MNFKNIVYAGACLLMLAHPFKTNAQSRLDVQGVALGRSTVASARGLNAITTNPAGLALLSRKTFSFTLLPFGTLAGSDFMSIKDFKHYFGGDGTTRVNAEGNTVANPRELTEEETAELGDIINSGRIAAIAEAMPVGLLYYDEGFGALAFALTTTAQTATQFPDDFSSFIKGDLGRRALALEDFSMGYARYSTYQLDYARSLFSSDSTHSLANFSVGAAAKFIRGYSYLESNEGSYARITPYTPQGWDSTQNWAVDINYGTRSAGIKEFDNFQTSSVLGLGDASGTGFGADIGAVMTLRTRETADPAISLGLSLMDAGVITWENNLEQYTLRVMDTITAVYGDSTQYTQYDGVRNKDIASFTTQLPMHLRFGGAAYLKNLIADFTVPIMVTLEYSQGLNKVGANSTDPRVAMGFEYTGMGWTPSVRTGLQVGGIEGFQWSGGLGWNINNSALIDLSLGNLTLLSGFSNVKWVGVGLRVQGNIMF
ncbi:MAG: DUF5723 family protein [Bacteroidota bacterium]